MTDLAEVAAAWPGLPTATLDAILAPIRWSQGGANAEPGRQPAANDPARRIFVAAGEGLVHARQSDEPALRLGVQEPMKKRWAILVIRLILAGTFLLYGILKLLHLQLTTGDLSDTRVGQLRPWVLTWIFFNHSPLYRYSIGIAQIITAALLVFPRTAPVGALCFFVIILNIVLINFGYDIATDVKILSSVLLALDCLLLLSYWRRYRLLLLPEASLGELLGPGGGPR